MRRFQIKTPASVSAGSTDHWVLFDTVSELVTRTSTKSPKLQYGYYGTDFTGYASYSDCVNWCATGKPELVPMSDKFLSEFERVTIATPKFRIVDDVTGAVPNVPAYLAGVPTNMRRKQREQSEQAPLAILVDTGTSSLIPAEAMQKRAAVLLALVRIVSAVRPVELWAGTAGNNGRSDQATYLFCRVETSPLDLARAAYMLGHASFARGILYNAEDMIEGWSGNWPYHGRALKPDAFKAVAAQAFHDDVLAIPGLHSTDKSVNDPAAWLRETLAALGIKQEG